MFVLIDLNHFFLVIVVVEKRTPSRDSNLTL